MCVSFLFDRKYTQKKIDIIDTHAQNKIQSLTDRYEIKLRKQLQSAYTVCIWHMRCVMRANWIALINDNTFLKRDNQFQYSPHPLAPKTNAKLIVIIVIIIVDGRKQSVSVCVDSLGLANHLRQSCRNIQPIHVLWVQCFYLFWIGHFIQ